MAQEVLPGRRRSDAIPRTDPRRAAAVVAAEGLRARARFSHSPRRACTTTPSTNIVPRAFFRLRQPEPGRARSRSDQPGDRRRAYDPAAGLTLLADRAARDWDSEEPERRRRDSAVPARSPAPITVTVRACRRRSTRNRFSMASTFPSTASARWWPSEPDFLKSGLARSRAWPTRPPASTGPTGRRPSRPRWPTDSRATRALDRPGAPSSLPEPGKSDSFSNSGVKEDQFEHALAESLGLSLQRRGGSGGRRATRPASAAARSRAGRAPTFTIAIPGQSFASRRAAEPEPRNRGCGSRRRSRPPDGKSWKIDGRDAARQSARRQRSVTRCALFGHRAARCGSHPSVLHAARRGTGLLRFDRSARTAICRWRPIRLSRHRARSPTGRRRASSAGGPDQSSAFRGLGMVPRSAAGGSRDFRDAWPRPPARCPWAPILRFHLHRAQQRERTGARARLRLSLPAGWRSKPDDGAVLHGARWRRPDHGLFGRARIRCSPASTASRQSPNIRARATRRAIGWPVIRACAPIRFTAPPSTAPWAWT